MPIAKNSPSPIRRGHIFLTVSLNMMRKRPAKENISFPTYLHDFFSSVFSCPAFGTALYPAIKKEPFPVKSTTSNMINIPTKIPWMIGSILPSPEILILSCPISRFKICFFNNTLRRQGKEPKRPSGARPQYSSRQLRGNAVLQGKDSRRTEPQGSTRSRTARRTSPA